MGKLSEIAVKAIDLVTAARDRARNELDDDEFDELEFNEDLATEFYEDHASFAAKYSQYLEKKLTKDEWNLIRGPSI